MSAPREFDGIIDAKLAATLDASLAAVLTPLMRDEPLAERFRDYPRTGEWVGFRDCYVKPDPVLICEKAADETLRLVSPGLTQ